MKTVVVTSQKELNELPEKFDQFTVVEIRSNEKIVVSVARGNSRVVARDNSHVVAWDNSHVVAWDNSHVVARGNSHVVARGNSHVVARGNSHVVARGNSHVEAWDNSHVVARGNSRVVAWDNSHVEAWDNSRVVARDNSHVEAWDNSHVEAWDNSHVVARGNSRVVARDNSHVVAWDNSHVVARGNSHVVARGNSHVVAWDNSHVEAWGNCEITAYFFSVIFMMSVHAKIKKLFDKSTAKLCVDFDARMIEEKHDTAQIIEKQEELSFETYLDRGYVKADGILRRLISRKKIGDVEVFEVEDSLGEKSFVVKKGGIFSHGETIEKAKDDLKYKISDRDTSEFENWSPDEGRPTEEMIKAYRVITGACEFGTKDFCEKMQLKEKYTPKEVVEITYGKYGNDKFAKFFNVSLMEIGKVAISEPRANI